MGIFNHHHATQSNLDETSKGYHMSGEDHENTSSNHGTSDNSHTQSSGSKSACGCGCSAKAKPMDEEVVEIKEEWDY